MCFYYFAYKPLSVLLTAYSIYDVTLLFASVTQCFLFVRQQAWRSSRKIQPGGGGKKEAGNRTKNPASQSENILFLTVSWLFFCCFLFFCCVWDCSSYMPSVLAPESVLGQFKPQGHCSATGWVLNISVAAARTFSGPPVPRCNGNAS